MILNHAVKGSGKPIIFLHGIAGSLNYWQAYTTLLSDRHKVIAIDLLGFGKSSHEALDYSVEAHCHAIKDTLDYLKIKEPLTFVGHSMGALLSLKYASIYPKDVSSLLLLNMPVYEDIVQAKAEITKSKKVWELVYYGPTSRALCTAWCYLLRPISKIIAPLYLRSFPRQVAEDSVLHSWRAFSESLHNVIEAQSVQEDIYKVTVPITMVYGDQESKIVLKNAASLRSEKNKKLYIHVVKGSHHLPLERPADLASMYISRSAS